MTNEQTIDEIMESARARITSENATPVTVARMPAEEVAALLDEIERLKAKLAEPARPEPGEWIEWKGAPIPNGAMHQVRFSNGDLSEIDVCASNWRWDDDGTDDDIVAYRVLP